MRPPIKLGVVRHGREEQARYGRVYDRQESGASHRFVIGADENAIALLLDLAQCLAGELYVLYVLLTPRAGHEPGRYESPPIAERADLELLLASYAEFLERDGRHSLWICATTGTAKLVYDHHGLVFAYGDLACVEERLRARGFSPGEPTIPAPHAHRYHPRYDDVERELMAHWAWKRFPLQPQDDDG